jgi:hypothetical protein
METKPGQKPDTKAKATAGPKMGFLASLFALAAARRSIHAARATKQKKYRPAAAGGPCWRKSNKKEHRNRRRQARQDRTAGRAG